MTSPSPNNLPSVGFDKLDCVSGFIHYFVPLFVPIATGMCGNEGELEGVGLLIPKFPIATTGVENT
jgi:hypothetical protein